MRVRFAPPIPGQFGTGDAAEDWSVVANQNGLYLFAGGDFWKISQELDKGDPAGTVPTWEDVNWAAEQTVCVKNDPKKHRIYILVPIGQATQPNLCWVLDYKELDTSTDLSTAPSLKIGITGKMLSTDKTRKWTRWNISSNCCDILVRPANDHEMTFAGGARNGEAYGNLYTLDEQLLTDDDYGQIFPYYCSYGFVNHELGGCSRPWHGQKAGPQNLRLYYWRGVRDHHAAWWIRSIIPCRNRRRACSWPIRIFPTCKIRIWSGLSECAESGFSFRIAVFPLPGQTDVQMRIQKMIIHMCKDPVVLNRAMSI